MHAQSCPTVCNPVDYSPSGSSVHRISRARTLEWDAISFSRGSSWPRDQTCISSASYIHRQILYHWHHLGSPVQCILTAYFMHNSLYFLILYLYIVPSPSLSSLVITLVCSLCLWVIFFVIFTSLLYFFNFTQKWCHTVSAFLCLTHLARCPPSPSMFCKQPNFIPCLCLSGVILFAFHCFSVPIFWHSSS